MGFGSGVGNLIKLSAAIVFLVIVVGVVAAVEKMNDKEVKAQFDRDMREVEQKVASDAVEQYEIAKRNGSQMDRCVQAGFVIAAFLQAQDEASYAKWKEIERKDCARAGLPAH